MTKTKSRVLSKFAEADEEQGVGGAQQLSVPDVLDGASTGATQLFAASVEFRENSEQRYAELQELALNHARHGETEELRAMLKHQLPVNLADHKGNTLLMLAAYHDHPETVQLLIDNGAEPDRRNDRGQTPLAGVAFKGYGAVASILLAAEADPLAPQGAGENGEEMTPLTFAKLFGRTEVEQLLTAAISS